MQNLTNPYRLPCPWACGFHTEYWDVLGEHACGCPHREWESPQAEPVVTVEEMLRAKAMADQTTALMEQVSTAYWAHYLCPSTPAD